jgi:hypothetical protein
VVILAGILWAPMLGGVWGGNVAILMFAAYVAAFWNQPAGHHLEPEPRDLDGSEPPGARVALLAAGVGGLKVSQAQAWIAIFGRAPIAALRGAIPWVLLVLITLPLVGVDLYVAWVQQLARASDPTWESMGPSLLRYMPSPLFGALTLGSFLIALRLRGRDTGVWLGIFMLLVTPNMHNHSALFLIPALLRIRREFALVSALLLGSYTDEGWWLGIIVAVGVMLLGRWWPVLREPLSGDRDPSR